MKLQTSVHIDASKIASKFEALIDDVCMLEVHDAFAKFMNDYVPMAEGYLSQNPVVQKDVVIYPPPYAHYIYVGEVYGPNIPIFEDGVLVGFFSSPGTGSKKPTGRQMQYNKEKHPKASKEWDKAMMAERGDEFKKEVHDVLMRRCKELYG